MCPGFPGACKESSDSMKSERNLLDDEADFLSIYRQRTSSPRSRELFLPAPPLYQGHPVGSHWSNATALLARRRHDGLSRSALSADSVGIRYDRFPSSPSSGCFPGLDRFGGWAGRDFATGVFPGGRLQRSFLPAPRIRFGGRFLVPDHGHQWL